MTAKVGSQPAGTGGNSHPGAGGCFTTVWPDDEGDEDPDDTLLLLLLPVPESSTPEHGDVDGAVLPLLVENKRAPRCWCCSRCARSLLAAGRHRSDGARSAATAAAAVVDIVAVDVAGTCW